jgi:hypothetical protein
MEKQFAIGPKVADLNEGASHKALWVGVKK